jgi:hypothetical protein
MVHIITARPYRVNLARIPPSDSLAVAADCAQVLGCCILPVCLKKVVTVTPCYYINYSITILLPHTLL